MLETYYQITTSDINITREDGGLNQRIKFISNIYLYESKYIPEKKKERSIVKKATEKVKILEQSQKRANRPSDAPDDIPDWMFEPITESEDLSQINKSTPTQSDKVEITTTQKETESVEDSFAGNVYHESPPSNSITLADNQSSKGNITDSRTNANLQFDINSTL